jgi:hypothetical protein
VTPRLFFARNLITLLPWLWAQGYGYDRTNRLRWYGTRPMMVCVFSKYAQTIKGKQSKLNSPLIGVGSTLACLTWSNGVPTGMMWLMASSCRREILSHGLNSRMDGFGATFDVEHWWACNKTCTCSFSWSPTRSPAAPYSNGRHQNTRVPHLFEKALHLARLTTSINQEEKMVG